MSAPVKLLGFEEVLVDPNLTADAEVELPALNTAIGCRVFLHALDNGGATPTLDVKVQVKSPSGDFVDIPGAAFAQVTTVETDAILTIYPGIAESANEKVSDVLGGRDVKFVFTSSGTIDYNVEAYVHWLG